MNLEDIKRNYENFDDEKLIEIATKDIKSLRKEVVPILEAELLKRNISLVDEEEKTITKTKKKQGNKNEIFTKENIAFMNSFEIPHILKNGKAYYVKGGITTIFSILLAVLLVLFLFKSQFGGGVKLILSTIIASVLFKMLLSKLNFGKIAEVQAAKIILPKYPTVNFGVFRIFILIRIALNNLGTYEFNFRDICNVYQKNKFANKGYYLDIVNSASRETTSHRVFLEVLSENDRNQILEIIKQKSDNLT
ncbi:hypothetical protein [Algibacter sp. L4_22]|uniref:hypothetical protein n=1 Tax=Algibacter sp. L4_22 TaxID=2942477 RepID=UPI00201B5AD1|nr:hypothetical protein [Algibacter sp. L4_22]MCL5126915.1 hypothetical protein [Algibacter sp. L4_22]